MIICRYEPLDCFLGPLTSAAAVSTETDQNGSNRTEDYNKDIGCIGLSSVIGCDTLHPRCRYRGYCKSDITCTNRRTVCAQYNILIMYTQI